jgi:DHA2 family multidrug resistance protein
LIGFGLVALTFGALEVVLDEGQEDDWFGSNFIVAFTVLAVVGLIALVAWELREAKGANRPILDLGLFTSGNFSTSFLMMFAFGFTLYATTVLLPQLLQTLMGYTAELSGFAMSSGGLATIICMPIVGILISKLDGHYLILFGFTSMALALYCMMSLDLQMSFAYAAKLRFLQSIGLAFLFSAHQYPDLRRCFVEQEQRRFRSCKPRAQHRWFCRDLVLYDGAGTPPASTPAISSAACIGRQRGLS